MVNPITVNELLELVARERGTVVGNEEFREAMSSKQVLQHFDSGC